MLTCSSAILAVEKREIWVYPFATFEHELLGRMKVDWCMKVEKSVEKIFR